MSGIILASASPRRRELLHQINLSFQVHPADVDETMAPDSEPAGFTLDTSARKAEAVARQYPEHLIIAADTVVTLDRRILGKPGSKEDAFAYLRMLSGRTHEVITSVTLMIYSEAGRPEECQFHVVTGVTFDELSDAEIHSYIATGSPMDKAGAYGIQEDRGALFVKSINGDYYNVVGLPLNRFYRELQSFAPRFLPESESIQQ